MRAGSTSTFHASSMTQAEISRREISHGFRDKVPAFAHARRKRLFLHRCTFHPFPRRRTRLDDLDALSIVQINLEVERMHRESDMREDVYQWWESSDLLRFAHVDIADIET